MQMLESPTTDWDARVNFPTVTTGFAAAAATVGYRPLYVMDGDAAALVLVRALPLPVIGSWTARARAYVSRADAPFLKRLVKALAARGIAHVRIGDGVQGVSRGAIEAASLPPVTTYLLEHAPAETDQELFQRIAPRRRSSLRRAEREGVVVSEVRTEAELAQYSALATETEKRARARDVGAVMPAAYFAAIFRTMVPRKQAVIFLARRGEEPLAGAIFLTSADRMTYVHAASTRDRNLTKLHGPTAVIWHALRVARARRFAHFDLGAVTPTDDATHPNHSVYYFKREFGGYVAELHHVEATLSPLKYAFQERVMLPVWKRAHGLYMTAFGARATAPAEAVSGTDLRWAGVPAAEPARPATALPAPWNVDELLAEIGRLRPGASPAAHARPSETARDRASMFVRALSATVGREAPRPIIEGTLDGGVALRWPAEVTGAYMVELVFFRGVIEYAVVDGSDVTAPEQRLVDGESSDPGIVLREIVKRYVVRM